MDNFENVMADVKNSFAALMASPIHSISQLPREMPKAGIYLFSENGKALYVGRTNNMRNRLQFHTRDNHNQATLAFLLARRKTGRLKASYQKEGSRSDLLNDPIFRSAFDEARDRIKRMSVQFIEERDPIKQALLEIYVAYQVKAEYNDFDNH